mmetsp:Transcript_55189/g.125483  ORF Transcript_55189/g.125483 Transcript_55189/m.125483 type:complete len:242 (-) Transcript_55189:175-900(-)
MKKSKPSPASPESLVSPASPRKKPPTVCWSPPRKRTTPPTGADPGDGSFEFAATGRPRRLAFRRVETNFPVGRPPAGAEPPAGSQTPEEGSLGDFVGGLRWARGLRVAFATGFFLCGRLFCAVQRLLVHLYAGPGLEVLVLEPGAELGHRHHAVEVLVQVRHHLPNLFLGLVLRQLVLHHAPHRVHDLGLAQEAVVVAVQHVQLLPNRQVHLDNVALYPRDHRLELRAHCGHHPVSLEGSF